MLITSGNYSEALPIYRRLLVLDNKELSTYHALALLYGVQRMPYSAIAILDSAELRLGRHPFLGAMKQSLLLDTHQYKRAIEEGERLCEESPYSVENHLALAEAYEVSRQDSLAEATYLRAYRIDTTNLSILAEVADYYNRVGNWRKMLDYEELLFKDKRAPVKDKERRLEQYTGNTEFYRDNYFRLGSIIVGLTMDYPTNRNFVNAYAMHLIGGGATDEAYDYMLRHIDDESATADDYIMLLQYMMFLERSDEEIQAMLDRATERFKGNDTLLSFKGFYYTETEEYNKALKIFKQGVKRAKKLEDNKLRSQYLGYIGDIYHEQGKDMKCFRAYYDALHYDENNIPVLNNYAYYLSLTGRGLDKALTMAHLAMSLDSGNATYIDTCAWVLYKMGRYEEAKKLMLRALSLDGQRDADLLAHYGDILWALGEKFMAETYWKKAIDKGYDKATMEKHINELKSEDVK
jgi:tetratricopeptide (TPR) repeat protein